MASATHPAPPRPGGPAWDRSLELESDAHATESSRPATNYLLTAQVLRCRPHWLEGLKRQGLGLKPAAAAAQANWKTSSPATARPAPGFVADQPFWRSAQRPTGRELWPPGSANSGSTGRAPYAALKGPVHWISLGARSDKTYPAKAQERPSTKRFFGLAEGPGDSWEATPGRDTYCRRWWQATNPRQRPISTAGPFTKAGESPGRPLRCPARAAPEWRGGGPGGWTCRGRPSCTSPTGCARNCAAAPAQRGEDGVGICSAALDPGPEGQGARRTDRSRVGGRYQVGLIDEMSRTPIHCVAHPALRPSSLPGFASPAGGMVEIRRQSDLRLPAAEILGILPGRAPLPPRGVVVPVARTVVAPQLALW